MEITQELAGYSAKGEAIVCYTLTNSKGAYVKLSNLEPISPGWVFRTGTEPLRMLFPVTPISDSIFRTRPISANRWAVMPTALPKAVLPWKEKNTDWPLQWRKPPSRRTSVYVCPALGKQG
jgi:hypothetical protein